MVILHFLLAARGYLRTAAIGAAGWLGEGNRKDAVLCNSNRLRGIEWNWL
jgi:hypothetical protein